MPELTDRAFFGGAQAKLNRLGLNHIWSELESALTDFELHRENRNNATHRLNLRKFLDERLRSLVAWEFKRRGYWTACHKIDGICAYLGVRMQFSVTPESDRLLVDLHYLCNGIIEGRIDVGALVVPSNNSFLTDRVARYTDAVKAVERARASDLPLAVLALEHDGPGPALIKRQTRQGRKPAG
jgi:hypothetical protein